MMDPIFVHRLETIMGYARYHRALGIRDSALHINACYFEPAFKLSATIDGSRGESYQIEIDLDLQLLFHDCPDFVGRACFCKHLGKLVLSLPENIRDEIIELYYNQIQRGDDLDLYGNGEEFETGIHLGNIQPPIPLENRRVNPKAELESFCINLEEYLMQYPEDQSQLNTFFTQKFISYINKNTAECCGWMNVNLQFFPSFQKMLVALCRPLPLYLERVPQETQFCLEFKTMIQRVLDEIDNKYVIPTAPGYQILL